MAIIVVSKDVHAILKLRKMRTGVPISRQVELMLSGVRDEVVANGSA